MPIATLTIGWPDENPKQTDRLPIESILHNETYNDYTPHLINTFYTHKESIEENKHFVELNHKETLAPVSYTHLDVYKRQPMARLVFIR